MGFFLRKRIKLSKGVSLNLSKSGIGISYGVKGFRIAQKPNGQTQLNAGRYGLYYRKNLNTKDNQGKIELNENDNNCRESIEENNSVITEGNYDNPIFKQYAKQTEKRFKKYCIISAIILLTLIITHHPILATLFGIYSFFHIRLKYFNVDGIVDKIYETACDLKNNKEYDKAIEYFNAVKEISPERTDKCSKIIFYCIKYNNDLETAYNYAVEHNVYFTKSEEKEILQELKKYDDLIEFIQSSYTKEEKDNKPSLYAELAEAFIAVGKTDIALQVLSN